MGDAGLRDLAVPRVVELGETGSGYFVVSERARGDFLDELDGVGMRAVLPRLLAALDAIRGIDVVADARVRRLVVRRQRSLRQLGPGAAGHQRGPAAHRGLARGVGAVVGRWRIVRARRMPNCASWPVTCRTRGR